MNRNTRLLPVALVFLFILTSAAVSQITIAVVPFNAGENLVYKDYYKNEFPVFLSDGLSKYKSIQIADRLNIQKVMDELHLSQTGLVDESSVPEIGKMLNANAILVGSVNRIGLHTTITVQSIDVATGSINFSVKETKIIKSHRSLYDVQESILKQIVSHYIPDGEIEPQNIQVVYQDDQGYHQRLRDGDRLKSATRYSIYVKPSEVIYLYAFLIDGAGDTRQLFPDHELTSEKNPLQSGQRVWLPDEDMPFYLGTDRGDKYICIFATPFKINDFEMKKRIQLKSKKMDHSASAVSGNDKVVDLDNLVQGIENKGGFVYKRWFRHE